MPLSKEEYEWVKRNAKFWSVPVPRVRDEDGVHDIAYSPQTKTILLGKLFQRSNPRIRKKKLTHEMLHHSLGVSHEQDMRDAGYYSKPEKDRLSERVVKKVEAVRNPASQYETYVVKDKATLDAREADWVSTFNSKSNNRAQEVARRNGILMITLANGEFIVYHTPDEKPHLIGPPYERNPLIGGLARGTRALARGMYQARVPSDIRGLREELQDEKAKLRKAEALAIAMERKERDGRATKEELEEAYEVYNEFMDSVLSLQDEISGFEQVTPFIRHNPLLLDLYNPRLPLGRATLGLVALILLKKFGGR